MMLQAEKSFRNDYHTMWYFVRCGAMKPHGFYRSEIRKYVNLFVKELYMMR